MSGIIPRIGVHTSISGKLANAIREAAELGCQTVQIFSRNPRGWVAAPLDPEQVREFFEAREHHAINPVVIHAPYLINLAAPDRVMWKRSVSAFRNEVRRAVELRADYLVVHPGSAKDQSAEFGIQSCVRGIKSAVRHLKLGTLQILIENTAGQGGHIGRTFEQVGEILSRLDGLPVGCCLDTAHTYAAGYDIATKAGLEATLSLIDEQVGLQRISVIHTNDTKVPLGGRVDRHWHIGEGNLGLKAFRELINHPALARRPFVLETPKQTPRDDPRNIAALKKLVA